MRGAKCPPRLPYSLGAMYVRPPRVIRSPLHMSSFVPALTPLLFLYSCGAAPSFGILVMGEHGRGTPSPLFVGLWFRYARFSGSFLRYRLLYAGITLVIHFETPERRDSADQADCPRPITVPSAPANRWWWPAYHQPVSSATVQRLSILLTFLNLMETRSRTHGLLGSNR